MNSFMRPLYLANGHSGTGPSIRGCKGVSSGLVQTPLSEVIRRSRSRRDPTFLRRVTPDRVIAFIGTYPEAHALGAYSPSPKPSFRFSLFQSFHMFGESALRSTDKPNRPSKSLFD